MGRQTPVIVASPRTRASARDLAQALADILARRPAVAAFDANPVSSRSPAGRRRSLDRRHPRPDGAVRPDGHRRSTAKIVDLGAATNSCRQRTARLAREMCRARRRAGGAVRRRRRPAHAAGYGLLRHQTAAGPAINAAVPVVPSRQPSSRLGGAPPRFSAGAVVRGVTERPGFSFAAYGQDQDATTLRLDPQGVPGIPRSQLRLLLDELKLLFQRALAGSLAAEPTPHSRGNGGSLPTRQRIVAPPFELPWTPFPVAIDLCAAPMRMCLKRALEAKLHPVHARNADAPKLAKPRQCGWLRASAPRCKVLERWQAPCPALGSIACAASPMLDAVSAPMRVSGRVNRP